MENPGDFTRILKTLTFAGFLPQAVEQLAVEFARAGADVTQTFTFWCTDDTDQAGSLSEKFSVY